MIVRTFDGLTALTTRAPHWSTPPSGSVPLYDSRQSYGEIFRSQINARIPIEFLDRNVAHLAPHVFRRVSETDRVRLPDHQLARWLGKPNPGTSRYRLFETLMGDLGVYMEAFWLKIRYVDARRRPQIGLVALPPEEMHVGGGLFPSSFVWTSNGRPKDFAADEIVYFNGYNPVDRLRGLSLFETLRPVLAEEAAAADHREGFWRNSARVEGVVTRPKEVKRYNDVQAKSWREQWQAIHAGRGGAGSTVLLQEGETFTPGGFSPKDSEGIAGMKMRRELMASGFQVSQPSIGILDHATYSNIREQHKNLYQDTLGPVLEMIRQEIHRQLLPECEDQADIYLEFNIDAKLAGTPEERASSIQISTGRPWRTGNEARALENLPRIDDPDMDRVASQQGGPATRPEAPAKAMTRTDDGGDPAEVAVRPIVEAAQRRQQARLQKIPAGERALAFGADLERWNRELTDDLTAVLGAAGAAARAEQTNRATFAALVAAERADA